MHNFLKYVYFDRWGFSTKAWEADAVIHGQQRAKYKWITVLYVSNTIKHVHVSRIVYLGNHTTWRQDPSHFVQYLLAMAKLHFCAQPWNCCMWFCTQYCRSRILCYSCNIGCNISGKWKMLCDMCSCVQVLSAVLSEYM